MRKLSFLCFVAAFLLIGIRLCTGIVYGEDAPIAFLALKAPSWSFARQATDADPHPRRFVLDIEEPELFYEKPYTLLMKSAPVLIAFLFLTGLALQRTAVRRLRLGPV